MVERWENGMEDDGASKRLWDGVERVGGVVLRRRLDSGWVGGQTSVGWLIGLFGLAAWPARCGGHTEL